MQTSRRRFLFGAAGLTGCLAFSALSRTVAAATNSSQDRVLGGVDLSGWETLLGDARRGDPSESDIETVHAGDYSELRANIHRRPVMPHNIALARVEDPAALQFVHVAQYEFRLPFVPQPDLRTTEGAQTIEGLLVTWDGSGERRDLGGGFQWHLNPWGGGDFGELRTWSTARDASGEWKRVGHLPVDTRWHTVRMEVDHPYRTMGLWIDGRLVSSSFSATSKPSSWGPETSARLTAEIVSCDPGSVGYRALHRAQFRNWSWIWQRR